MIKVCKFGGTSMANKASLEQVKSIIASEDERRFVVVSAPGKRFSADEKVTDLLYKSFDERNGEAKAYAKIRERFNEIVSELSLGIDIAPLLDEVEEGIKNSKTPDYAASRGEFLSAYIFAKYVGMDFVDAADIIKFNEKGEFLSSVTNGLVEKRLYNSKGAVIGGFYGSMPDGSIKTFSRGGSDVTGAIIARGVNADIYENWTDVNGFFTTDPRIVKEAKNIAVLSYEELRELAYMGASVLHPESIFPVQNVGIPINIRNTFEPSHGGTMIVKDIKDVKDRPLVTGIAGKKGYMTLTIKKTMMNNELGFGRKVLSVLERHGVSFEHLPTGIDTMSVIFAASGLDAATAELIKKEVSDEVNPDFIELTNNLALIAVVGHGMANMKGTAAKVFKALAEVDINIKMIDQGSSEMNIIVGVKDEDLNIAIGAIYKEFFTHT